MIKDGFRVLCFIMMYIKSIRSNKFLKSLLFALVIQKEAQSCYILVLRNCDSLFQMVWFV